MTKTIYKRKEVLLIGIIIVLSVIGISLWRYYTTPSTYLALDVNPSIEIHTNRLNEVTSINPVNEDAKQIMAGYQLSDRNLETVIKNIVDRMLLNGYIAPDKDNQILITTNKDKNSAKLSSTVNGIIGTYLTEKQVDANLIPQAIQVTAQSIKEAHKNAVSAGKMAIIKKLIENDSTLTVENLSSERISDLITLAISKNISLNGIVYHNTMKDASSVTEIQSDVNDNVKVDDQTTDDNEVQDNNNDSDKEDQNKNQSNEVKKVKKSSYNESKKENVKDVENEDKNTYKNDSENEDNSDSKIETEVDNEDQNDNNIEDKQGLDEKDSENEIESGDHEYKNNDSQDKNYEENQKDGYNEEHSDSQNQNHDEESYDD